LSTDGSGNNTLNANTIKDGSATKTLATLSSSAVTLHNDVTFPAGHIVQVKFVGFVGNQVIGDGSSTGTTFVNVGLGVSGEEFSIAMSVSSGNKIVGFGNVNVSGGIAYSALKVFMDSTQIALGTGSGSRSSVTVSSMTNNDIVNFDHTMSNSSFSFNYTPSDTSSHTYSIKAGNTNAGNAYTLINQPPTDTDANYTHRGYSHYILMEVAQ